MTYHEAKAVRDAYINFLQLSGRAKRDAHGVIRLGWHPVAKHYFFKEERDLLVRCGFAKSKGRYLVITEKGMHCNAFFDTLGCFEEEEARGREARWQAFCGGLL